MGCTSSQPEYAEPDNRSVHTANGGNHSVGRQDSGRSLRSNASSKQRWQRKGAATTNARNGIGNNTSNHDPEDSHRSIPPSSDPRYIQIWQTHKELLLDPADLHATMDACMASATNKLSATEVTFLQRKVRSIIRASNQTHEKGTRMFRNTNSSLEQEVKTIAEKHRLLSNHVVRKVLPKVPVSTGSETDDGDEYFKRFLVADNVFLLCLYLHESLWDRVASIASTSAQDTGVEMDVNKYQLPEEIPDPVSPSTTPPPEIPSGISLHALAFMVGLALRGTRMQRLQLLFYVLLPPRQLESFMSEHPAGGPPLWLLEVGSNVVLSLASLAHYYYYGDTFVPASDFVHNIGSYKPSEASKLTLEKNTVVSFLQSILMHPELPESEDAKNPGLSESTSNGSLATSPPKKPAKMRRRTSNQTSDDVLPSAQTEVMEKLVDARFKVSDYVQDSGSLTSILSAALERLEGKDHISMHEFFDFCQEAVNDEALDAVMYRLFAHTLLPSPSMEVQLVQWRWREWQETECLLYNKAAGEPEGAFEKLTQSVRKMILIQREENAESTVSVKESSWKPFGGIGGLDGRGGMGFGVMYCIDRSWWMAWEEYTGWSWAGEGTDHATQKFRRKGQRPGILSSETLLDHYDDKIIPGTYGAYELMQRGLKRDEDYCLIPGNVWDVLYELYGGGPPLPRMVQPPGSRVMDASMRSLMETHATPTSCPPLKSAPSGEVLDELAALNNTEHVLRIPRQMEVITHPWVFHVHLCDPQQPYRRGDAGPLSIRVMAHPDQPLWRLLSELVVRLPFPQQRIYGEDSRGRARLWIRTDRGTGTRAPSTFGPWALLCKNRFAALPKLGNDKEVKNWEELKKNWQNFADHASIESVGLIDGDSLMVECAILNRIGGFVWPREAAAKAGRAKQLEEKNMKFRQMLKGVDENGNPLSEPKDLVGMRVDAMDPSGKWFQVEIEKVQTVVVDTDEEDSAEEDGKVGAESKQVLVDFTDHGGHSEWIDVDSDRLASAGRFTLETVDDLLDPGEKPSHATGGANTADNNKSGTQAKKTTEVSENNGKLCSIPGYGACGLANLGNTCYANSAIQCISYFPLLRSYLLSSQYKLTGDLNKDNPLGTEGKLLEEFAELLRQMWSGKIGELSPTRFKRALGAANELFQGADQQDSQEFLSFILDALHEDSNRVRKKPLVEGLEDDWKKKTKLPRVGDEEWRRYLRRNRSIMADVGMGQVLNTVTCPVCNFSSRNFDPFNLLSLPFPTVADVIFKCFVVRRASALNSPWVLNKPRKGSKARARFKRDVPSNPKPPSKQLVVEEYVIPMSRLADSGDLKLQIQNLSGIPASEMIVCRSEISKTVGNDNSVVRSHSQVTLLTDKEGPCSQLANRQRANSEDLAAAPSTPSLIVAFETTVRPRPHPQDDPKGEDSTDSNTEEDEEDSADNSWVPTGKELKELEKNIDQYGNLEECRLYDTDVTLVAKALSRSLWPRTENDLRLGLRVDALDQKQHWCPGSIVEIMEDDEDQSPKIKVRIHFDNFSSRWDEKKTIQDFLEGRIRPLYSHTQPRSKPTEFIVHHRYTDRTTRTSTLFGQSFYVQCLSEWTTARAGAQILAQASRFLKLPREFRGVATDEHGKEREAKVQRLYERTQSVISELIDVLIECDREYIRSALGISSGSRSGDTLNEVERFRNPGFDASDLSQDLIHSVGALLHKLPFEVRVCTIDSTLGGTNEELSFPFSFLRSIGNYMNARHAIVLQWREPPSDKKTTNGRNGNYLGAPVMYVPPPAAIDAGSVDMLNNASKDAKRSPNVRGSGGLPLGVCLTEFCKLQQLTTWRCPKCKDFRDGKQNMALWRLPDLLTIHLKRFNCSAGWREKITTKVNFPLTGLSLEEWCHSESPVIQEDSTGETCVYDLVGVLNHYGGMTGGHYVAACKATACSRDGSEEVAYDFNGAGAGKPNFSGGELDPDIQSGWKFGRQKPEVNQKRVTAMSTARAASESAEPLWLQFDDDLVEPIPPSLVISETAYVLFYRRRRMTSSNIAKYSTLE